MLTYENITKGSFKLIFILSYHWIFFCYCSPKYICCIALYDLNLRKKVLTTIVINVALRCSFPLFKYTLGDIKSDLKLFNKHTP